MMNHRHVLWLSLLYLSLKHWRCKIFYIILWSSLWHCLHICYLLEYSVRHWNEGHNFFRMNFHHDVPRFPKNGRRWLLRMMKYIIAYIAWLTYQTKNCLSHKNEINKYVYIRIFIEEVLNIRGRTAL